MTEGDQIQEEPHGEQTPPEKEASFTKELVDDLGPLLSPTLFLTVIGLLVLVVVGLFGGWERATAEADQGIPTIKPDQPVEIGPVKAEVRGGAVYGTEFEGIRYEADGLRYIMIGVELTSTLDEPVHFSVVADMFEIQAEGLAMTELEDGKSTQKPPTNVRVMDAIPQSTLQPDFPIELLLIWEQEDYVPPPEELTIVLHDKTYRESSLGNGKDWLDREPAYQLTVKVKEWTGEQ